MRMAVDPDNDAALALQAASDSLADRAASPSDDADPSFQPAAAGPLRRAHSLNALPDHIRFDVASVRPRSRAVADADRRGGFERPMSANFRIFGSEMSPYSVKVRSYFRFKRIPHV